MRVVEIERQDGQHRYVAIDEDGGLVEPIVCYPNTLTALARIVTVPHI